MTKIKKKLNEIQKNIIEETSLYKICDNRLLNTTFIYWKLCLIILFIALCIYMDFIDVSQYYFEFFEIHRINYNFWLSIINISLLISLYSKLKNLSIDTVALNLKLENLISEYLMGEKKYSTFYFNVHNDKIYLDVYILGKLNSVIKRYDESINQYCIYNSFISPKKNKTLLNSINENRMNIIRQHEENVYILRDGKKYSLKEITRYKMSEIINDNIYDYFDSMLSKGWFGGTVENLEMKIEDVAINPYQQLFSLNIPYTSDEYTMFIEILELIHKEIKV